MDSEFQISIMSNSGPFMRITITHLPTGISEFAVGTSSYKLKKYLMKLLKERIADEKDKS